MRLAIADGGDGDDGHIQGFQKAPALDEHVAAHAKGQQREEEIDDDQVGRFEDDVHLAQIFRFIRTPVKRRKTKRKGTKGPKCKGKNWLARKWTIFRKPCAFVSWRPGVKNQLFRGVAAGRFDCSGDCLWGQFVVDWGEDRGHIIGDVQRVGVKIVRRLVTNDRQTFSILRQ